MNRATAFFGGVATDTDATDSVTPHGVELSALLRSPRSPERLHYAVSLPAGASLRAGPQGAVDVVQGARILDEILPPTAMDAQKSAVPVSMQVIGSTLIVTVRHRSHSFAYPILVDPQVVASADLGQWGESGYISPFDAHLYMVDDPYGLVAEAGRYVFGGGAEGAYWKWVATAPIAGAIGPATWWFYDLTLVGDAANVQSAGIYVGGCNGTAPHGLISTRPGQIQSFGAVSGTDNNSCPYQQPVLQNQLLGGAGTSDGAALYLGAFLVTYNCTSNCGSSPTGFGQSDNAQPNTPRANCGSWPVNCQNGNQFEVQTDLSIPGRGLGLSVVRTYNSQAAAQGLSGPFGAGWSSSYSDHLTLNQTAGTATVTEADGNQVSFTISGSSYVAPNWSHASLVQNADGTYTFKLVNQDSFIFDSNGRLLSESDRNGEADTAGYDSQGRLSTITDPGGRQITLSYNPDGTVASASDSAGRSVSYSYSSGNLVGVTDADGGTWSFGYDASHQLTSETDPRQHTVTTAYNGSNQVVSQTDPMNRTRTWTYSSGDTLIHNPDGTQTDEHFNGNLLSSITHAYGTSLAATTNFAYGAHQDLAGIADARGNVTSFVYDAGGNLVRKTDPLGRVTKWTYDSLNDVKSMTNPSGVTTTYTYDSRGNLLSATTPLAGTNQSQTTTYTRGDSNHPGDVTAITDPNGHTTSYTYDADGDLASVTDPLGDKTTYAYDSLGRLTSKVSPRGNAAGADPLSFTTTYGYDAMSRLTSETDPLGNTQAWSYDGEGNLVSYTDGNSHTTGYSYDSDNELTKVTRADTTTLQSSYDPAGNLTSQTDGAGHTTSYGYNGLERLTSITDPLLRTTAYGYDANGNPTTITDPLNRVTTDSYDADNELTSISYSDGHTPNVSYGYNGNGLRTTMSDGSGTSHYSYDSLGRLTTTTDGAGNTISYGYDLVGEPTSITYPNSQAISRTYDDAERLASITDWLNHTTSFAYDPDGNLHTTTFPGSTSNTDSYSYNDADQLNGITMTQGSSTLANLSYTRDSAGLISGETQTGLPGAVSTAYGYTALNQLASAGSTSYGHDNADNLTQLDGSTGYTYDVAHELTSSPGATYGYDTLGERTTATPTGGQATSFAYDQAGRLTTFTPPTGSATTYAYNGDGLRTSKTTSGATSHFTWDQTPTLPLLLADGQNSYIYGPLGLPIEQIGPSGTPSYLHEDQLGSVRMMTDQNGNLTGSFSYSPYGALIASTGTASTPFGYAGQYTDSETGLQYDRARYYDPITGQFITTDPLAGQTWQPYGYAAGDPLALTDPSGMDVVCGPSPCLDTTPGVPDTNDTTPTTPAPDVPSAEPRDTLLNPDVHTDPVPEVNNEINSLFDLGKALTEAIQVLCDPLYNGGPGSVIVTARGDGSWWPIARGMAFHLSCDGRSATLSRSGSSTNLARKTTRATTQMRSCART